MYLNHVTAGYQLVQLANGTQAVYAAAYDEKMHPGLGPAAEAEALYVRQLKIPERLRAGTGEFVVWDIGLGAAANAVTLIKATHGIPRHLRIISFDNTPGPAEFALANASKLEYLSGYELALERVLTKSLVNIRYPERYVEWEFHLGDFPALMASPTGFIAPDAIFFDAFSPAKNPVMWTLPVFTNLFRRLDPNRPCSLTTYSRSTILRVTLLLAGFFVGRGVATGLKEETTVAANALALLDDPLPRTWLDRARRSDSAEPIREPVYNRAPLTTESWKKLQAHPQFL